MDRSVERGSSLRFAVQLDQSPGMGLPDLYPFVLAPTVIVSSPSHDRIRAQLDRGETPNGRCGRCSPASSSGSERRERAETTGPAPAGLPRVSFKQLEIQLLRQCWPAAARSRHGPEIA
jgi:hypothetical protein